MVDRRDTPVTLAVRLGLVLLAGVFLWLMNQALQAVRETYAASFQLPGPWPWLRTAALGVLAGAAFAAAGRYGTWPATYRYGRVIVLGAIPLAMVIISALMFSTSPPPLPDLLLRFVFNHLTLLAAPSTPLAPVLLGVALVSGWTHRPDARPSDDENQASSSSAASGSL